MMLMNGQKKKCNYNLIFKKLFYNIYYVNMLALALASSGFAIAAPDVMIDNTKPDMGGEYLLQTIPFRAFAASETAQIIGITISQTWVNTNSEAV